MEVQSGSMTAEAQLKFLERLKEHKKDKDNDETNKSS